MISNIKNAYAMLYFEKYGSQYFDLPKIPKIEITPITDEKTLKEMPW